MLMPSDRHTEEDLKLWAELEAADIIHAKSARLARKEKGAIRVIRSFLKRGRCYCGMSGGKDSAVVCHLLSRIDNTVPVRWLATEPLIDPHCRDAIAAIVAACGLTTYREHTNWCVWDADGWHATGTLEAGMRSIACEVGTRRYLSGIRADEAAGRKMRFLVHGYETKNTCAPLSLWSANDVFAYAAKYHLPLHPTYGMMGGGRWPRERLRVAFLGLKHGRSFGRLEWEREYYADVLAKIKEGDA